MTKSIESLITTAHDDFTIATEQFASHTMTDHPLFKLNLTFMRCATIDLTASLDYSINPDYEYNYTDSTHDEISNPAFIIADCNNLNALIFDDDRSDAMHSALLAMIDNLNTELYDYDIDAEPTFDSIDDIITSLKTSYNLAPSTQTLI